MSKSQSRSFHPTGKFENHVENGSSALGTFFCIFLAGIVSYWICQDTSANLTASLHHEIHYTSKAGGTGFFPLDIILDWL